MAKKIISVILVAAIAFSCVSVSVKAEETLVPIDTGVFDVIAQFDPNSNTSFVNAIKSLASLGTIASSVMNAYNGIMSVMKLLGVVPDPEAQFKKTVISKLNEINNTTQQINEKIDSLKEDLDRQFASVNLQFDKARVGQLKQNINAFNTDYEEKMSNTLSNFAHTIDAKFNLWYNNGKGKLSDGSTDRGFEAEIYLIEPDEKVDVTKLSKEEIEKSTQRDKVTLDGALVNQAIKDSGFAFKSSSYSKDLEKVFEQYFNTAVSSLPKPSSQGTEDNIYGKSGFLRWYVDFIKSNSQYSMMVPVSINKDSTISDLAFFIYTYNSLKIVPLMNERTEIKQKARKAFVNSAINHLTTAFVKEIATEGYGTSGQYVNTICNQFENYCKQIVNISSDMSPLANQLEIFSKTYNFQGEIIDTVYEIRNFFICNLTRYAELYFTIMGVADISDYNRYLNIYNQAVNSLYQMVENFVVKDQNGNVVKNYSYQIGAPIELKSATLSQSMTITHIQWENFFGGEYDAYDGSSKQPWKFDAPDNKIASNNEMLKLYAVYKCTNTDKKSFNDYLEQNMFGTTGNYNNVSSIVTSRVKTQDFNLSNGIKMQVDNHGFRSEHFDDMSYFNVNSGETPSGYEPENEYFRVHDSAVADTFNMTNGTNSSNVTLQSRALYGYNTSSVQKDRMAFFYTGSNKNVDVKSSDKGDEHTQYDRTLSTSDQYYYISKETVEKDLFTVNCFSVNNISANSDDLQIKTVIPNYFFEKGDDVSYGIFYDEEKYLTGDAAVDTEIHQGFINYACQQKVIDSMVADYYQKIEDIVSTGLLNEDGIVNLPIDKESMDGIVNAVIKKYIPDISKAREIDGSYVIDGKEGDFYVPTLNSKGLKLSYCFTYIPIYRLECDKGNYSYQILDFFDITPVISWDNDSHYIIIEDSVLKSLDLKLTVKIPVLEYMEKNSANIEHYYNEQSLQTPYEIFSAKIKNNGKGNYLEFEADSFSPYHIKEFYDAEACSHIDEDKDHFCDWCGDKISEHNGVHQQGVAATLQNAGYKDFYMCECGKCFEDADCKIEITDIEQWKSEGGKGYLPKLEEQPSDNPTEEPSEKSSEQKSSEQKSPLTGDNSNIEVWFTILIVSTLVLCICLTVDKKKKKCE